MLQRVQYVLLLPAQTQDPIVYYPGRELALLSDAPLPAIYCKRSITQSMCDYSSLGLAQRHPGSPHPAFNVNSTFSDT